MENNSDETGFSSSGTFRPRKSIFANIKPNPDSDNPKLFINGESLQSEPNNNVKTSKTSPNFYPSVLNEGAHIYARLPVQMGQSVRRTTGSFYTADNPLSRVIIATPYQKTNPVQCIRPSSQGRGSVMMNPSQIIQNQPQILRNSRVMPVQTSVLTSSKIIPSQNSNIIVSSMQPNHLVKKSILMGARPAERIVYTDSSPIKHRPVEIISEGIPEVSRIIVRDDPKTIGQLNKLASLNQFLSQQYNMVNHQLNEFRNKTSLKQFVDDKTFLERSLHRIDDIFLRQTNQALHRLDQISRNSQSCKKFVKNSSVSKFNRNPMYHTLQTMHRTTNNNSSSYTPIKNVQHMRNSSYIVCQHQEIHEDPLSVYEQDI